MADNFKEISETLSAAGQVSPEDLQQAAETGFKSVLNLRSPDESGVLSDEAEQAQANGLAYANVPLSNSTIDSQQIALALEEIETLPKPILVHCGAGLRAGAIALIAATTHENLSLQELLARAEQLGIDPQQPHLQQFIQDRYGHENLPG